MGFCEGCKEEGRKEAIGEIIDFLKMYKTLPQRNILLSKLEKLKEGK